VMLKYLKKALDPMFITAPTILCDLPEFVDDFLIDLTESVGSLFIVLGEIGAAFSADGLDDFEQRDKFLSFSSNVVGKWLSLKNVFFVLLGRGFFLSYV